MSERTGWAISGLLLPPVLLGFIGCSTPLTTREKGALIGTGVGAATGAAVGSAVGHTGAGAAIGGAVGLGAGALIGDQMQAREQEQQRQVQQSKAETDQKHRPPYFLPREREIIREYYYYSASSGLPPGLAKRGGNLPPGLQKHLQKNGTLPPGLQKRLQPIPFDLEKRLPGIPEIWARVILGGHVLLLDRRSNLILDILENVVT